MTSLSLFPGSGMEEMDGTYDSDEDADFTKMDMVSGRVTSFKPYINLVQNGV